MYLKRQRVMKSIVSALVVVLLTGGFSRGGVCAVAGQERRGTVVELNCFEEFSWDSAVELFPGVLHCHVVMKNPRLLNIHVLRVELGRGGFRFNTTRPDPDHGKQMPDYGNGIIQTRRERTTEFLKAEHRRNPNMLMAVNAAPWRPWSRPYNHVYAGGLGFAVADGEIVSSAAGRPAFIAYRNGEVEMRNSRDDEKFDEIAAAVSGFAMILEDGRIAVSDKSKHPRTGLGLSEDKKYFFVLVVDGRQPELSMGATTTEMASWLRNAGAYRAINMDGGGSSTLAIVENNTVRLLNHPSSSGYTRPVGNSLGLYHVTAE